MQPVPERKHGPSLKFRTARAIKTHAGKIPDVRLYHLSAHGNFDKHCLTIGLDAQGVNPGS